MRQENAYSNPPPMQDGKYTEAQPNYYNQNNQNQVPNFQQAPIHDVQNEMNQTKS